jgi:hypothetical protein
MSYTLELNSGDELEINFALMNDLLAKHGYNTADMYLYKTRDYSYIQFTNPSESYPTTMKVQASSNWSYLYINDTKTIGLRYWGYV